MAGTSWPALTAGRKAKASEVELKFDWIEGSIVPMLAGAQVDGTYDLGTLTAQWNYIYAKSGFMHDGVDVRLYGFIAG